MAFMKSVGAVRNEAIRIFLPCLVGVVSGWVVAYAVIYSAAALFSVEALVPLERWERPFVALLGVIGALLALHVTGNGLHTPLRILADHLRHKKFHKFMTEQEIRDYTPEDMAIMEDACNATGPEPSPEMVVFSDSRVVDFLTQFGRGNWLTVDRSTDPTLLGLLYMMNDGNNVNRSLGTATASVGVNNRVHEVNAKYSDDSEAIQRMFLATLSRYATADELKLVLGRRTGPRYQWLSDLQWALLNKLDFAFNY